MELTQLRYFMTVANCGQVIQAAELLHVSQSAVSMAISRLEKELGVELFERHGRYIYLTQNGEHFRRMVIAPIAELEFAHTEIQRMNLIEPNTVSLSVEMPDFATHFEHVYFQHHPEVRFQQAMDTTESARQKICCAMVDFCISFEPFHEPDITSLLLLTEPALVQLAPEHPLYHCDSLQLADLRDCEFVSFCSEYSFRRWMDGMCILAGFRPPMRFEVCDTQSLLRMVTDSAAVSFIAQSTSEWNQSVGKASSVIGEIKDIPLTDKYCVRNIFLSYHKNRILSQAAQDFLSFAMQFRSAYERLGHVNATEKWILEHVSF